MNQALETWFCVTMKGAPLNGSTSTVYEYDVLPKGSGIAPHAENC